MAESAVPPVTFGVKVTRETPGHVTFAVFAGDNSTARGLAGTLIMRPAEFHAFLDRLKPETLAQARRGEGFTVIDETHHLTADEVERFSKEAAGVEVTSWQRDVLRHHFNGTAKQDRAAGSENTDG